MTIITAFVRPIHWPLTQAMNRLIQSGIEMPHSKKKPRTSVRGASQNSY